MRNTLLYQTLAYNIHGKILKNSYKDNKFTNRTWNGDLELPDGSCSISDIQDYYEYILKQHEEKTVNPSIRIYIKNRKKNYA